MHVKTSIFHVFNYVQVTECSAMQRWEYTLYPTPCNDAPPFQPMWEGDVREGPVVPSCPIASY